MVKPLVQFRLSDEELELLRSFSDEGESEGLTAKRLLLQLISADKSQAVTTPLQLTDDLKNYITEEVEQRTQYIVDSNNDMLKRLQQEMKQLQNKVAELQQSKEEKPARKTRTKKTEPKTWEEKLDNELGKALGD